MAKLKYEDEYPTNKKKKTLDKLYDRTYGNYKTEAEETATEAPEAYVPTSKNSTPLDKAEEYTYGNYKKEPEATAASEKDGFGKRSDPLDEYLSGRYKNETEAPEAEEPVKTEYGEASESDAVKDESTVRDPNTYPGVKRDHIELIGDTGINKYYYSLLTQKIMSGVAPTAADYLNAYTKMTVDAAEAQAAKAAQYFEEKDIVPGNFVEGYGKSTGAGGVTASSAKTAAKANAAGTRSLEDIYKEYLDGAYYKNAIEESKRTGEDVLGKYAAMTGGMPSTAAARAAAGAENEVMSDAQKYLWQLAQDQYGAENKTAEAKADAEREKYTSMIDSYLSMGYGVDDVPEEWWARSGYDKDYAGGVADYYEKTSDANAASASASGAESDRTYFRSLLQTYINKNMNVPSWLWEAAGVGTEAAAESGDPAAADNTVVGGITTKNSKDYESYAATAKKMFDRGDKQWRSYVQSIEDSTLFMAVMDYLAANTDITKRDITYDSGVFKDEFGNEWTEDELRKAIEAEDKTVDAKSFIRKIKGTDAESAFGAARFWKE